MAYKFQLGDAIMSGALEQEEGITIEKGGLAVTAGGIQVTAGALALNAQGISAAGALGGVTTIAASGLASLDGGINVNDDFTVNADGAVVAVGVNAGGAVSGVTSLDGSGDLTMGTITMTGFTVDADGDTVVKTVSGSGAASFGSMTLDGELALQSAGIDDAGPIDGVTTLDATGLASLDGGINVIDKFTVSTAGAVVADSTVSGAAATFDDLSATRLASQLTISGSGGFLAGGGMQATGDISGSGIFYTNGGYVMNNDRSIRAIGQSTGLKFEADGDVEFHDGAFDFDIASHDGSNGLQLGGSLVTATAANINVLTGVTAGTVAASKALVVDASRNLGSGVDGINNLFLDGNIDVDGNATIDGSVALGNASADLLGFSGSVASDFVPDVTSVWDLGSSEKYFDNIYVNTIHGGSVTWDTEKIASSGQTIATASEFALMGFSNGNVTLPTATAGKAVRVKLSGSSVNVQINAASGDTIEDAGSILLESKGAAVTLISYDDQAWFVI